MKSRRTVFINHFATEFERYSRCKNDPHFAEAARNADDALDAMIELLPSGGGIDTGTKFDSDRSTPQKLVFICEYHHMNDVGMYDGWTQHTITVRPTFQGIDITISGRDRNQIKDYLYEVYYQTFKQEIDCFADGTIHAVHWWNAPKSVFVEA